MSERSERAPGRILVVADRTCPCPELHAFVRDRLGDPPASVLVVAPAFNDSRLAYRVSDSDAAMAAARERLAAAIDGIAADGISVEGVVGDARPLTALEDALAGFAPDEVIVSTYPAGASHSLEKGLLEDARALLDVPVRHFVTEYGLEEERLPA